jgi:O-antigen ligase
LINKFFKYREQVYVYLLMLVLYSFMVSYAISSISVFLLLLFFFLDNKSNIREKIKTIKTNKPALGYVIFFVIQCLGLVYSDNIDFGLRRINVMLPLLFVPAIIFSEKLNYSKYTPLLTFLKYWIALVLFYHITIHVFIEGRPLSNFVLYVINDKLGISQFYIIFILLIPILDCLFKIQIKAQILFNILFLFLFLFFIVLMSNRTAFLLLSIMILIKGFYLLRLKKTKHRIIFLVVLSTTFMALIFVPKIKTRIDVLLKTTDLNIDTIITKNSVTFTNNTFEQRLLINYLSYNEIKKHFPFGVGTGDFQDVLYRNYKEINFKRALAGNFNNHNQYASEFLKTGILGGFCFLFLILMLLRKASMKDQYYIYLIVFFSFANFFESYLFRQHGVLIFSFIIPLFLVVEQCLKHNTINNFD